MQGRTNSSCWLVFATAAGRQRCRCRRMDQSIKHHLHTSSSLSTVCLVSSVARGLHAGWRSCLGRGESIIHTLYIRPRVPKRDRAESGKSNDRRLEVIESRGFPCVKTCPSTTRYYSYRVWACCSGRKIRPGRLSARCIYPPKKAKSTLQKLYGPSRPLTYIYTAFAHNGPFVFAALRIPKTCPAREASTA